MADLRTRTAVKIVDPTTNANAAGVNANDNLQVIVNEALPTGANTIGAVNLAEHGELDDAAVSVGGALVMAGLVFDDTTPVVVEEGDAGYQRMSLNRNAYTVIRDDAGNERGVNVTASNELQVLASAQPGVDIGDVDVLSVTPGTAAGNLGKAENAPSAGGDTLVAIAAVQDATLSALGSIDGDYTQVRVNANGALWVEDVSAGGGGTAEIDDAAFTTGTDSYTPIGGIFDDTAPNDLEENDGGVVRMSAKREMYTNIRDGAGNERSANVTASNELNVIASAQPGVDIGDVTINGAPTGASAIEVQGTVAEGAAVANNPFLIAGDDGTNVRHVLVDAAGHLQVDVLTGGGSDTPTSPAAPHSSSTDTAAAGTTNIDSADFGAATKKLAGLDFGASVPVKAEIQSVDNGTPTTLNVLFAKAGETVHWRPPHRDYYTTVFTANAGFDGYRAVLTNLDNSEAANLYGTIYSED